MEPLIIRGTENSPEVRLDATSNRFIITGKSRPENADKFYAPLISWIERFEPILSGRKQDSDGNPIPVFKFKLEYFNSTSAKHIAEIIIILKDFVEKGYKVKIEWHSAKFDDDMLDTGKEFSNMVDLKFDFIEY